MPIRLRLPELLEQRDRTPYAVATASGGRVTLSTLYRLVRARGHAPTYSADVIEALCEGLGVSPCDLFERSAPAKKTPAKKVARRVKLDRR